MWNLAIRMEMVLAKSQEPPSEGEIASFEKAMRIVLPDDYKGFLRSANGGVPDRRVFICNGVDRLIERFLPMMKDPSKDPEAGQYEIEVVMAQLEQRIAVDPDELGSKLIPVAYLFAGDFVCLDFRAGGSPQVVVWDHEQSDDYAPVTTVVAGSFTEFREKLVLAP